MAVVNAKKCDICGYVYEDVAHDEPELAIELGEEKYEDMCPRCYHKIIETIGYLRQPKRSFSDKRIMSRSEFDSMKRA